MRKTLNILIICLSIFCLNLFKVSAYNVSSGNNPGSTYNGNGNGGVSGNTYWPVNEDGKSLRAIRIRIFRNNTEINSAYYSLAEDSKKCYNSVSSVTLCETNSYGYSSVAESTGATCSSGKNVDLGCIVSNNLLKTWGVRSSNGEYLDNYLKNDNYTNLKSILSGMKYNDTNFNNNDVVIIEPATLVKCNGVNYFGTSTAMMKKNISYNGSATNVCYDSSNASSDIYPGGNFINLFKSMSVALKVSTEKAYLGDSSYTDFGFFRYNVSGMGYKDPDGDLKVEIYVDGTNPKQLITSDKLTFNIREGHNCTGKILKKDLSTGISGFKTETLLTGNYSVEIVGKPSSSNYLEKAGINYTCRNVTLTSSGITVSIPFEKGCNIEKNEYSSDGYTISDAITLYNKYKFNGLLNTSTPTCSKVDCNNSVNDIGCLSANLQSKISSTNLTCADIYTNASGNAVVFCGDMFSVVNNLIYNGNSINTFYGTSGEFLIKKDNSNLYRIYNENNLPYYVSAQNGISTVSSKRICYILNGSTLPATYDSTPKEIVANLYEKKLTKIEEITVPKITTSEGVFSVNTMETRYNLELNEVHLMKISGKIADNSSNNTISVFGLISKFKETNGSIPFSVIYNSNEYTASNENTCKYNLLRRIINFEEKENGKIELEFRVIDTNNPFIRETNYNWSDGDDNSSDNSIVQQFIKNRTNSYGINSGSTVEPIYKIVLTPSDIRLIREYNKLNSYDNYLTQKVKYNSNEIIRNSFLYNLEQGRVNTETLSNKLYNYKYSN